MHLEPKRACPKEFFREYTQCLAVSTIKAPYRCSTGLYRGHLKYSNFQSEAKVEQIIAIVTTRSVFYIK